MEGKFQLLKSRNFGDVVNDTLAFVKLNYKALGQVIITLVLPILIIGSYFFSQYFAAIFNMFGKHDIQGLGKAVMGSALSIIIGYVGIIAGSLCMQLAVYALTIKYEQTEDGVVTAADIYTMIKNNFFRYLGFIIVVGLLFFFVFFMLALFVGVMASISDFFILLMVVLFFGVFYVAIAMCLSPMVFLREQVGIFEALRRSFQLVKGFWWQTFGIIIVVYFICSFASIIFVIPFYALMVTKMLHSIQVGVLEGMEFGNWEKVSSVFMMCGSVIVSSLIIIAISIQYYSLVERKEGEDINKRINEIGLPESPVPNL